jgi:hypothetical protein
VVPSIIIIKSKEVAHSIKQLNFEIKINFTLKLTQDVYCGHGGCPFSQFTSAATIFLGGVCFHQNGFSLKRVFIKIELGVPFHLK